MRKSIPIITSCVWLLAATIGYAQNAAPKVVINEFSYYHPLGNRMDFIELLNNDTTPVNLEDLNIFLIDGPGSTYNLLQPPVLTGTIEPGGYFVIGAPNGVANADITPFSETQDNIKRDTGSIALVHLGFGPVDAVGYGDEFTGGFKGSAISEYDSIPGANSFSRLPNGADSDDNSNDFELVCMTPGKENVIVSVCGFDNELKINEIQLSGDSVKAEIYNPSDSAAYVDNYKVGYTVDALAGYTYKNLSGVIAGNGYQIVAISDEYVNESHFELLRPTNSSNPVDAVIDNFTVGIVLTDIPTPEGNIPVPEADASDELNWSRIPNGEDTDNNAADFEFVCASLGSENINTTDCTNSIDEVASLETVVYPNPSNGVITVQFQDELKEGQLRVVNNLGQTVWLQPVNGVDRIVINSIWESGVYFVSVIMPDGGETRPTKLFVR